MASDIDRAKRALVTLIKQLARKYKYQTDTSRDSSDGDVRKCYRSLSRKVHPDRAGTHTDAQMRRDVQRRAEMQTDARECPPMCGRPERLA